MAGSGDTGHRRDDPARSGPAKPGRGSPATCSKLQPPGRESDAEMAEHPPQGGLSRRELLTRVGILGAAAAIPGRALAWAREAAPAHNAALPLMQAPVREAFETLIAAESDTLEAIVARLIPTDENGPGATEARAAHYIDRALAGALSPSREAYAEGLAAVDAYAQASKAAPFARLSAGDQDAVLSDMEQNVATGFESGSSTFFNLLLRHTIEGTFCDPYYGGNAGFVGWDLVGYPGVRTAVTAEQQRRMGVDLAPNHISAYDNEAFTKSSARMSSRGGTRHGD